MSRFKQYILVFLLILLASLSFYTYISSDKLRREKKLFGNFKDQSSALILLKQKYKQNKDYKKIFARLRAISKPSKDTTIGNRHTFYFENLSQVSLQRLNSILFNSGFVIKKLDIQKRRDKVSLHIEVKI
ncbi:MAG: hypothetical protein QM482_09190 [Sulfurospirillum sp.]